MVKISLAALLGIAPFASAAGTGPYSSSYRTDPSLPRHTIFAPTSPPSSLKLPVLVWGQTGCTGNSLVFQAFLLEVASHGVFIIANGTPNGPGNANGVADTTNPNPALHKEAIDWVSKIAGSAGNYSTVDASRLAVSGQSCGAAQAYAIVTDPRVTAIGIFNSGIVKAEDPTPGLIKIPIFYFLGGPTDIAYTNGERDYTRLPASTPKWKGNLPIGHMGDYSKANGGKFGVAAVNWVKWVLRGNSTVSTRTFFTGSGPGTAKGDGWDVVQESLEGIKITSWD